MDPNGDPVSDPEIAIDGGTAFAVAGSSFDLDDAYFNGDVLYLDVNASDHRVRTNVSVEVTQVGSQTVEIVLEVGGLNGAEAE